MRNVFADTHYWIALASPNDEWHEAAESVGTRLGITRLTTTDEVLIEFLAYFSSKGSYWRETALRLVKMTMANPNVTVVQQTRDSFNSGLGLFEQRFDKAYSLTDCISMQTMRQQNLREVLTHDHHFTQEGFIILLTDDGPH